MAIFDFNYTSPYTESSYLGQYQREKENKINMFSRQNLTESPLTRDTAAHFPKSYKPEVK